MLSHYPFPYCSWAGWSGPGFVPYYYFYYYPLVNPFRRQYQEVDPAIFMSSAKHMKPLLKDAGTLLNKMADSWKFAFDLMSAAQESNQQKVETIIKGAGISLVPKITYNPDGLNLYFTSIDNQVECCHLTLQLRWN